MVKITPQALSGTVQTPPSKSYAHRGLISAFLSGEKCEIKNLHLSADISATLDCIKQLGAEWKYNKKVTDSLNPFSYVYSCITELSDGSIVDLYESDKAEFSLKGYSLDELKVNESNKLSLVDSIKSRIYNKTRK